MSAAKEKIEWQDRSCQNESLVQFVGHILIDEKLWWKHESKAGEALMSFPIQKS